ncbi:hypothetical protein M2447_001978 [Ereboglobus sp. PH5-10]|uniref:hypothetical protein n=1 Tax=Ereboglobus sp. PH5-10 TaxID=2940629 RepID=UPI002404E449|nr:hypothetical protein [Ereboglobus sp. PH5-10]MDF9827873.1 hypothetical protein [Ereboglobus sp. PH5-10]
MRKLIQKYHSLLADPGFLRFQHARIAEVYDQLGQGYTNNEGEVALVTRIANTLKGQSYHGLRIHCEKIHGSKSYVSFNFRNKPTSKELGDLILVTVVSDGKRRLLQKLCIVQNKMLRNGKAHIDEEQLFLLKNFPLFSGSKGMFRGAKDVVFRNTQMCLGAYGFFEAPGELIHVNAGVLSNTLNGSSSFTKTALASGASNAGQHLRGNDTCVFPWSDDLMILHEIFCIWHKRGFPLPLISLISPLFSSQRTLHDLHDFIRAWTSFQIGEIVYAFDHTLDREAEMFSNAVLRAAGLSEFIDLSDDNIQGEFSVDSTIMVSHLDISKE